MNRIFNVSADCRPELHYMVDISDRLEQIEKMVDNGQYFTINRARQYGKTTTLQALKKILRQKYLVISLDFQMISYADFESELSFTGAFAREVLDSLDTFDDIPSEVLGRLQAFANGEVANATLSLLFKCLIEWCRKITKGIVLIIDEVDSATNNQVFLDFLAQLRGYYIQRNSKRRTFQSVILAGVYDIKNLKRKFVTDNDHKLNSPWNIAADFLVDMSFSASDISGMLCEYEKDHTTGMNLEGMAELIYNYTSGYPFLVSRICKLIDEQVAGSKNFPSQSAAWTKAGFLEAVKLLLSEKNTLFESMAEKLNTYPELKKIIYSLLFQGQYIVYNPDDGIDSAMMFGFIKFNNGMVIIANRIFETRLYNFFLTSSEMQGNDMYRAAHRRDCRLSCRTIRN